ncbi:hypothetical protein, partial [Tolypothrix sp. VBCCA 56010]|uniref:hypothetical protein n=1 Tax=Tolypothrix sp. VBCCA 56010 TaxID=3137731 RepID=UPI003D7EB7B3
MSYCNEKKQAIVTYSFAGGEVKRFETDKVPIDVTTGYADNASGVGLHELKRNPFNFLDRYSFTIEAPSGVPRNLNPKPDIYLLAGLWDDYGT